MDKLDFVKQAKTLYVPKQEPAVVRVPSMLFLTFDGQGNPENNLALQKAFGALYGVIFTIKFLPKQGITVPGYQDFKVAPPEGLWWMKDDQPFEQGDADDWRWTLMLRVPEFVTPQLVAYTTDKLVAKKNDTVYRQVKLRRIEEGEAIQLMHIGPYNQEQASVARLQTAAEEKGYHFTGKHHEIYFGDPRRTAPEKLRTVLRHPIARE